jgi:hypothetical protein
MQEKAEEQKKSGGSSFNVAANLGLISKAEEQKKSGGSSMNVPANLGLISFKTVHLFTTTKFYKQVLAAQEYLA